MSSALLFLLLGALKNIFREIDGQNRLLKILAVALFFSREIPNMKERLRDFFSPHNSDKKIKIARLEKEAPYRIMLHQIHVIESAKHFL